MASANFGLYTEQPDNPMAEEMAEGYMALMNRRCGLHCSAPATKRWKHTFKMILKEHNPADVATVLYLLEMEWTDRVYSNPNTLREQFGPLVFKAAKEYPELFVKLPELPERSTWPKWVAAFSSEWPVPTTEQICVTALRVQLFILRAAAPSVGVGWPIAAMWLDHICKQWHGWAGAPQPTSFTVYWRLGCKRDQQLDQFLDPTLRKALRASKRN